MHQPSSITGIADLARKHAAAGRFLEAAEAYARLRRLGAAVPAELRLAEADALARIGRFRETAAILSELPRSGEIAVSAASLWFRMRRITEARELLESSSAHEPQSAMALLEVLDRANDPAALLRVISAWPGGAEVPPRALLFKGLAQVRLGEAAAAIETLRRAMAASGADFGTRYRSGMELARVLDRTGEYELAWNVLAKARSEAARHPAVPRLQDAFFALARQVMDELKAPRSPHRTDVPEESLPVLLAGPPRSGTTLAARLIGRFPHFQVFDETDAFEMAAPGRPGAAERYRTILGEYGGNASGRALDKNPSLLTRIPAWRSVFPGAPLILTDRDPMDLWLSSWFLYLPLNPWSACLLDPATAARAVRVNRGLAEAAAGTHEGPFAWMRYEEMVRDAPALPAAVRNALGIATADVAGPMPVLEASPNYPIARREVFTDSVGREKRYRAWIPDVVRGILAGEED